MIGAALDTRRRALGLSIAETAALLGVEQEKSIRRWINDEVAPRDPQSVLERLDDLEEMMDGIVDGIIAAACDATAVGPVRLARYGTQDALDRAMNQLGAATIGLPLGAHAIVVAWADEQLAAQGIDTIIEWSD